MPNSGLWVRTTSKVTLATIRSTSRGTSAAPDTVAPGGDQHVVGAEQMALGALIQLDLDFFQPVQAYPAAVADVAVLHHAEFPFSRLHPRPPAEGRQTLGYIGNVGYLEHHRRNIP